MKKILSIAIPSALLLIAGGIVGVVIYRKRRKPTFGERLVEYAKRYGRLQDVVFIGCRNPAAKKVSPREASAFKP